MLQARKSCGASSCLASPRQRVAFEEEARFQAALVHSGLALQEAAHFHLQNCTRAPDARMDRRNRPPSALISEIFDEERQVQERKKVRKWRVQNWIDSSASPSKCPCIGTYKHCRARTNRTILSCTCLPCNRTDTAHPDATPSRDSSQHPEPKLQVARDLEVSYLVS